MAPTLDEFDEPKPNGGGPGSDAPELAVSDERLVQSWAAMLNGGPTAAPLPFSIELGYLRIPEHGFHIHARSIVAIVPDAEDRAVVTLGNGAKFTLPIPAVDLAKEWSRLAQANQAPDTQHLNPNDY